MKFIPFKIKRSIKHTLYALLFYSGLFYLLFAFYLKVIKRDYPVVILFYHRFKERNETTVLSRLWVNSFAQQMLFLQNWCDVISLDELIEKIKNKEDISKPTVVITIDDGFRDNYDVAYPILKNLGLPATIYLTSGLIDTQEVPWVDEIGTALMETNLNSLSLPEPFNTNVLAISTCEQKTAALHSIYKTLLYLEHDSKITLVHQLLEILNEGDEAVTRKRIMLNWQEIREMNQNGVSFGAHTMTHPTLSRMSQEDAELEIYESKRIIERELECEVKHFAIPNGQDEDFTEPLRDFCRQGLFTSITSTKFGYVTKFSDPYNLPRVCIHGSLCYFSIELARLLVKKGRQI